MSIAPQYNKIITTDKSERITENVKVETKTQILSEEIKKILSISAFSVITKLDEGEKKITANGKVVFYLCYESSEGQIKKCEINDEFSCNIERDGVNLNSLSVDSSVVKTQGALEGIYLSVSALISVNFSYSKVVEYNALTGGEELILDLAEITTERGLGVKKTVLPLESQFDLSYSVDEVLFQQAKPIVTQVQCGVGAIIVDGEVRISSILLQNGEKKDIIKEVKTIPFSAQIECEEAMPVMTARANCSLKSFKTDLTVDGENGQSIANVSILLNLSGEAFATENLTIALDAFSLCDEVECQIKDAEIYRASDLRFCTAREDLTLAFKEQDGGLSLKALGEEKCEIISSTCEENVMTVTGTVFALGYFISEDNKLFVRKLETPFEARFDCILPCDAITKVCGECEVEAFTLNETGAEVSMQFYFSVTADQKESKRFVGEIKSNGQKCVCESAISVYIPYAGESLWSLCKRLNQSPEALRETNKDLEFPLTGDERIVIYRQK